MSKPPPFQRFQVTMVKSYVKPLPLDAPNASRTLTAPAAKTPEDLNVHVSLVHSSCSRKPFRMQQFFASVAPIDPRYAASHLAYLLLSACDPTLQRTEIVGQCRNSLVLMTEETRQAHRCGVWSFHGRSAARGVRVVLFRRLCGERGATVSRFQIQLQLRLR